jgi:hypothetical protein
MRRNNEIEIIVNPISANAPYSEGRGRAADEGDEAGR